MLDVSKAQGVCDKKLSVQRRKTLPLNPQRLRLLLTIMRCLEKRVEVY